MQYRRKEVARKGTLRATLTPEDFDWLDKPIEKGTVVHEYTGFTYGCITENGIAVSLSPNGDNFFEVPVGMVDWEE